MTDREDLEFPSGTDRIAAWLYRPHDAAGPSPLIVLGHGLGAVRTMRLDAYAERFRAAGFACLVFDYRNFGDSGGHPRQLLDIRAQLADWAAALRHARTVPGVDPERMALWGSSFGGGHVLATAAREPGVAAVVAQCPFTDAWASARVQSPVTSARLTWRAVRDLVGARLGRAPLMVAVSGRPGEVALMTAPDAHDGYAALRPAGAPVPDEVAARFALKMTTYRPGRGTGRIDVPVLFCVCETDTVAPAPATLRHAAKAPRGEVRTYPYGHFEIYLGEAFERVSADQIEFLRRHLGG